jgi:hypothetical protein
MVCIMLCNLILQPTPPTINTVFVPMKEWVFGPYYYIESNASAGIAGSTCVSHRSLRGLNQHRKNSFLHMY